MPPTQESPVKTQMAVAVLDGPLNGQYHGCNGKPTGWRRVFVQTDTGSVLSLELDRADNAHTVKKKMQIALNEPIEETSLTFGDIVLKNDLSVVRNDAPLRLTRGSMQRSSSTPCLSPTVDNHLHHLDSSGLVEIVGGSQFCPKLKKLVRAVVKGLERGVEPVAVRGGLGGAYYFRNCNGENVAIVKPTDEEPFAPNNPKGFVGNALGNPGLKRSVRVGETGIREVAAYILDHDNSAKVPPTVLVKITHPIFNVNETSLCKNKEHTVSKIASFQQFVPHDFDASDHGTSSFPVAAVHRIGILDIRLLNTDRHGGNLLVKNLTRVGKYSQVGGDLVDLIPIDHGLCLPENLEDPYFEWLHWPQASIPFSEEELHYIEMLDPVKDTEMLRRELPMVREACLRVLMVCTTFLKLAAEAGLCLAEIGVMMSREFDGVEEEPSALELICVQAKMEVDQELSLKLEDDHLYSPPHEDHMAEQFHIDLDFEEDIDYNEVPSFFENEASSFHFNNNQPNDIKAPISHLSFPHTGAEIQSYSFINGTTTRAACPSPRTPCGRRGALSKLEEDLCLDESEMNEQKTNAKCENGHTLDERPSLVSGLSSSFRSFSLNARNHGLPPRPQPVKNCSSRGMSNHGAVRSGQEQSADAVNYFKFNEMSDPEWVLFFRYFQELLPGVLASRKNRNSSQRQRLGTSCQF